MTSFLVAVGCGAICGSALTVLVVIWTFWKAAYDHWANT